MFSSTKGASKEEFLFLALDSFIKTIFSDIIKYPVMIMLTKTFKQLSSIKTTQIKIHGNFQVWAIEEPLKKVRVFMQKKNKNNNPSIQCK